MIRSQDSALSNVRSSVSETEEWVCAKMILTNGSITRGFEKTYTGGETFSTCLTMEGGTRCICTSQFCNNSPRTNTLLAIWLIVILFTYLIRFL